MFNRLWRECGGADLDMIATTASAQRIPTGLEYEGTPWPFFSRYATEGSAGVDVFSQDVTIVPNAKRGCFGFCFPPSDLVGVVLHFCTYERGKLMSCGGSGTRPAKVVVPQTRLEKATIRAQSNSEPGKSHHFFRMHHQRGSEVFTFPHWGMRAVEVHFRG